VLPPRGRARLVAGSDVLEQQPEKEQAGTIFVLLKDHELVEIDVRRNVGAELDADHVARRELGPELVCCSIAAILTVIRSCNGSTQRTRNSPR
jgi:hypothetical protein